MGCTTNTDSIDLSVSGGTLEADLVVDPAAGKSPNQLVVDATGVYVSSDGWVPLGATLAYSSADAPTFVATTSADLTSFIGPGDRVRLVQSATDLYFIVTAISAGNVTLYGGTDYVLANSAITSPVFSKAKSPIGFPLSAAKWTVTFRDTSSRTQSSPVNGTWYNLGSGALSFSLPIGSWDVTFESTVYLTYPGAGAPQVYSTLSTANNSESDSDFTGTAAAHSPATLSNPVATFARRKTIDIAAKTSYYANIKTSDGGVSAIGFYSNTAPMVVEARCNYL